MEKSNKSQKDKSDKKSDKQGMFNNWVSVKNIDDLKACIESESPFRFVDPPFVLAFNQLVTVPKKRIIEALRYDTTITHLILTPIDKKEMKALVKCLTRFNRGIKKLSLLDLHFDSYTIDSIITILKANQHIKSLEISMQSDSENFSTKGLKLFCRNMDRFTFEELILSSFHLPQDYFELKTIQFLNSLKNNRSIQSMDVSHVLLEDKAYGVLCEVLVNNRIKEFNHRVHHPARDPDQIQQTLPKYYESFTRVLRANHLTKLKLEGTLQGIINPVANDIGLVSEDLKKNTSLTDLTVHTNDYTDWKTLGEVIDSKKNLKRLCIRDTCMFGTEIRHLNLGSNTSITDLTITSHVELNYPILFADLCNNNTLRRLEVGSRASVPADLLGNYLKNNRSLTDLKIDVTYSNVPSKIIATLFSAITGNQVLRKLSVQIPRIEFNDLVVVVDALKHNKGLLELHIGNIKDTILDSGPPNGGSIDSYLLDALNTNKSLRYIESAEAFPHIEERLKENREVQDKSIRDTRTIIRMIVARPTLFVLPKEIWFNIFNFVSYPFKDFDFAEYLLALNKAY